MILSIFIREMLTSVLETFVDMTLFINPKDYLRKLRT